MNPEDALLAILAYNADHSLHKLSDIEGIDEIISAQITSDMANE